MAITKFEMRISIKGRTERPIFYARSIKDVLAQPSMKFAKVEFCESTMLSEAERIELGISDESTVYRMDPC